MGNAIEALIRINLPAEKLFDSDSYQLEDSEYVKPIDLVGWCKRFSSVFQQDSGSKSEKFCGFNLVPSDSFRTQSHHTI